MIDSIDFASRKMASLSAAIGSILLAGMVGLILLEIVLRNIFSHSTGFTDEFVAYGVSVVTFFGLARALQTGVLIRVNLLLHAVPGRLRHLLEIVGSVIALALTGFLTWHLGQIVLRDYVLERTSNSVASTPLWVPEGLLLLGLASFILRLVAHALVSIRSFIRNDRVLNAGLSETEVIHG